MNIYIIHGDNSIASYEKFREYLDKARNEGWEIINIDNKDKTIKDVLRSYSLFNQKRIISIRNYNLIDKVTLDYLNNYKDDLELFIYHDNLIPPAFIQKLHSIKKNEVFRLSKHLWKFIDNFYPGNSKVLFYHLNESVKSDPIELIFSILTGYLKDLYLFLNSKKGLNYPPWRIQKIELLSSKFGKERLNEVINELANIDMKVKTTSTNLKDELDLFILRKLE
jgi:DNA polymerase III delta subunit